MSESKSRLQRAFERVEFWSDEVRARLRKFDEDILITPYLGFGNNKQIQLRGRVMEDKDYTESSETDSAWKNLRNIYRHFETDEVPNARLRAIFKNVETEVSTDKEGYFDVSIDTQIPKSKELWQKVELELLEPKPVNIKAPKTHGRVLIPNELAKFGVISDIDDTVLKTNVNNRFKMILTTILSNAHTRVPFEGVAAFYRALTSGKTGIEQNPIFYISSSPYNLYNLLIRFFELQRIPEGPIFLKDFGIHTPFTSGDHGTHKLGLIRNVLDTVTHLPFVLIGDNGEQDPDIYDQIVAEYPDRIRAIYIRNVNPKRKDRTEAISNRTRQRGSEMILVENTESAAKHATDRRLISEESLRLIEEESNLDKNSPGIEEINEDHLVG